MTMTNDVANVLTGLPRPLERIEAEMVELSGQLAGGTCRFLLLVGEYDAAEGWRQWGASDEQVDIAPAHAGDTSLR